MFGVNPAGANYPLLPIKAYVLARLCILWASGSCVGQFMWLKLINEVKKGLKTSPFSQ